MGANRHERLGELFLEASELPPARRRAFLEEQCGADRALRDQVQSMLEADSGSHLEAPASDVDLVAMAGGGSSPGSAETEHADRVGGYEVLRKIGEGGMGIVYEARQAHPDRTVALKVMRPTDDGAALRRFEHEARLLGWLQHPAIAHVYEAATSGDGESDRPFIAMELVEGVPVDRFVREEGLDIESILVLLVQIAEGVRHAHQKGVVHRDLKPANILVQPGGDPKILDFGVACIAPTEDHERSLLTRAGDVVGTVAYMSPEQITEGGQVDTQSDVYAIGVIAYELLAGKRPVDTEGAPVPEVMRRVVEDEPEPLTSARPGLPADVATVVHKALSKDRDRRYPSIEAFADDIGRYLRREPILARPASAAYKLRRFVQRNRGTTFGLALAAAALVAGACLSTWLFLREQKALRAEQDTSSALATSQAELEAALERSNQRLALLQRTNRLFEDLMSAPLPGQSGAEVKMMDVLRRAAAESTDEFKESPEQAAWLAAALSTSFSGIRLHEEALEQAERAKAALAELAEPDAITAGMVHGAVARSLVELRRYDDAEEEIAEGLEVLAGVIGDMAAMVRVDLLYGEALMRFDERRYDEASAALATAEQELSTCEDPPTSERAGLVNLRVEILWSAGKLDEAEAMALECLEDLEEEGRSESSIAHLLQNSLGAIYYNSGRAADALPLMDAALAGTRRQVGDEHEFVAKQLGNIGTLNRQVGNLEKALEFYDEATEVSRRVFEPGHPSLAQTLSLRGSLFLQLKRWDEGERDLLEAIEMLEGQEGADAGVNRAMAMGYLSPALREKGDVAGAEQRLQDAIRIKAGVLGTELHPLLLYDFRELSNCAKDRGAFDEMFDQSMRALEITLKFEGPASSASKGLIARLEDALRLMEEAGVDAEARRAALSRVLEP